MTFQEALRHLDQKRFSPCYLLSGEEPFFVQELLRRFRERAVETAADFNYDRLQGEEVRPAELLLIAQTFPVFSPRRLVIVQNADRIEGDGEALLPYLESPCETSTLVFVAAKPDMRKKFFAALKKKGTVITCPPLYDNEVSGWIAQEARKKGLQFSQEALWRLKEHLGNDLFAIQQEIEKLALYLSDEAARDEAPLGAGPPERKVSIETVEQVIGGGRSHSIFEWVKAVAERDLGGSLKLLTTLVSEGEPPLFMLAMLTRQWRLMASAKAGLLAGKSESALGKKLPMPPRVLSSFFQQLKRWRIEEIRRGFDLFLAADSQLKGGRQSSPSVLEALVLDLCRSEPPDRSRPGYTVPFLSRP